MISRLYSRIVLPIVFSSSSGFCRWRCRVWILGAALACLNTCMSSWKSKGTPLCHPSQEIGHINGWWWVKIPYIIRPYFLGGGWHWGGDALRFPWLPVTSPQAVHQTGADDMTIVTWTNHYMWWWIGWKGVWLFGASFKRIKVACDLHYIPEASLVINWMYLRL